MKRCRFGVGSAPGGFAWAAWSPVGLVGGGVLPEESAAFAAANAFAARYSCGQVEAMVLDSSDRSAALSVAELLDRVACSVPWLGGRAVAS